MRPTTDILRVLNTHTHIENRYFFLGGGGSCLRHSFCEMESLFFFARARMSSIFFLPLCYLSPKIKIGEVKIKKKNGENGRIMETRISSFLFPSSSIKMLNFIFFFSKSDLPVVLRKKSGTHAQTKRRCRITFSIRCLHTRTSITFFQSYPPPYIGLIFFFHSKRSDNCCPVMFKHVFFPSSSSKSRDFSFFLF